MEDYTRKHYTHADSTWYAFSVSFVLILVGIALLYFGGELLVRHASNLAKLFRLSPVVIGLTVVAFGTSAPELAATLTATLRGTPEIAIGNVIGSNIANLGLILAIAALIFPITTRARFLKRELPFMILVAVLLFLVLMNSTVSRLEGMFLFGLLLIYLVFLLRQEDESPAVEAEFAEAVGEATVPLWHALFGVVIGLGLLVLGAQSLVEGAVTLARALGVSERVIGLTMVAIGTSLPELASSVVAALKREGGIILGNIVGSNVFNVLAILGIASLVHPIQVPFATVATDVWVVLIFSLLVLPFLWTGLRLGRREAAVLLAGYGAYVAFLFV
jgi:cation:H+ antiporter